MKKVLFCLFILLACFTSCEVETETKPNNTPTQINNPETTNEETPEAPEETQSEKTLCIYNQIGVCDRNKSKGLKIDLVFLDNTYKTELVLPPDESGKYFGTSVSNINNLASLKLMDKTISNTMLTNIKNSDYLVFYAYILDADDNYYFVVIDSKQNTVFDTYL